MSKKAFFLVLLVCLTLVGMLFSKDRAGHYGPSRIYGQTIPSPTFTSVPITPAPTNTPDDGGGGNNNTPVPNTATPTATAIPVTIAPTPLNGFLPTAQPCGEPPTIQVFNTVNIRTGPGIDYDLLGKLVFREVRPIVGRAEFADWWLIELASGEQGWITNNFGIITGYIGNVPIVPVPPINGSTPTPSVRFQPTADPLCPTATPSATATATATFVATNTAVPTPTSSSRIQTAQTTEGSADESDAATKIAAAITPPPDTPVPTSFAETVDAPYPVNITPQQIQTTAVPPVIIPDPPNRPSLLPIIGLVLVAAGIFVSIARRQMGKQ
jgi:hypothetical protein